MAESHPQVGAPDPELETSPVVGEDGDEEIEPEGSGPVCYFNGVSYPIGQYVLSGHEVLRCDSPGLWVRMGELDA